MPFNNRVQKSTSAKKRRGRPKKYSESWTKKLILLRFCGLQLSDTLSILNLQGNDSFTAKDRRPQQLVRQLLSDGNHRFCSPDQSTARKRAAFMRKAGGRNGDLKFKIHKSTRVSSHRRRQYPSAKPAPPGSSNALEVGLVPPFIPNAEVSFGIAADETLPTGLHDPDSYNTRSCPLDDKKIMSESSKIISKRSDDEPQARNSTTLSSDRRSRVQEVLSRASFSQSFVSDLVSILDTRFSISTLATSSRCSISVTSLAGTESSSSLSHSKAAEVLELHRKNVVEANAALIRDCCSIGGDCIHRQITRHIDPAFDCDALCSLVHLNDLLEEMQSAEKLDMSFDLHCSNSPLHFAARSGAPARILLPLVNHSATVNDVDANGQNLLFFLDPRGLDGQCDCSTLRCHTSQLACLIHALKARKFNFDQIDNDGRSFLSYLCASPSFDIRWLSSFFSMGDEWQHRVLRLSRLRDSVGTFLLDFVALHPRYEAMRKYVHLLVQPPLDSNFIGVKLPDEDENGRTYFHNWIRDWKPQESAPLLLRLWTANINRYDSFGRTPIMDFPEKALERGVDEKVICEGVRYLIQGGANINARS